MTGRVARRGDEKYSVDLSTLCEITDAGYDEWIAGEVPSPSLHSVITGQRPFALAPIGRITQRSLGYFRSLGLVPVAICDRRESTWGSEVEGIQVMSYERVVDQFPDVVLLVTSALFDSQIREDARSHGLPDTVGYCELVRLDQTTFANREYRDLTRSVFEDGAIDKIATLFGRLDDEESRRTLLSKVFYYLTSDKSLLQDIATSEVIYFDSSVLQLTENEVVIDAGAFTGDTLASFRGVFGGTKYSYFAFEPDRTAFERMVSSTGADPRGAVHFEDVGLGSADATVDFVVGGMADSSPAPFSSGEEEQLVIESVRVIRADRYFEGRDKPTFVKMDVEGGERDALSGAGDLLSRYKPSLAVSAYHFPKDLWEIPLLIDDLAGSGTLVLRHYTSEIDDTVCYLLQQRHKLSAHG